MPLTIDEVRDLCPHFSDESRVIQLVDSRIQTLAFQPQSTLQLSSRLWKASPGSGRFPTPWERHELVLLEEGFL